MQSLVVCGGPWAPLGPVHHVLQSAGCTTAQPTSTGSITTLEEWYRRLFAEQTNPSAAIRPSKPWELAAGELFLANWNQPLWSWADSRSTWLLDFWRDFDPDIRFVLVHSPVQTALTQAIEGGDNTAFDGAHFAQQWCTYEAELLRFYHRNRSRCVLLAADTVGTAPQRALESINQAFGIALHVDANCAALAPSAAPGMVRMLVHKLLQEQPSLSALQQEFDATLPGAPSADAATQPLGLPTFGDLVAELCALSMLRGEKARLENEVEILHETSQHEKQLHQTEHQQLTQENELLLLQLHQVQEELEHCFLQHQHAAQEKKQLQERLERVLRRYPDYCEWDRIEHIPGETPRWHIHGFKALGREVALLDIALANPDHPTLILAPPAAEAPPVLLHWPAALNSGDSPETLHLQPGANPATQGAANMLRYLAPSDLQLLQQPGANPATQGAANMLRYLAPSDLQLLQTACGTLAQWLPQHDSAHEDAALLLQTLRSQLQQLPATWRFDAVQLKLEHQEPHYEHLWFVLTNATFGDRQWPQFEFRLSAANIQKGKFSSQPKLEFPQMAQGPAPFENWFEESADDRGPKFELRFDTQATAFDMNLWNALSNLDKVQALSIVAHLPQLLGRLQRQQTRIHRPWADWTQLVRDMQRTLATCLGVKDVVFDMV